MAMLSLADHNILTYGTFGLWAAFLSKNFDEKRVILPKGFERIDTMQDIIKAKFSNWEFV